MASILNTGSILEGHGAPNPRYTILNSVVSLRGLVLLEFVSPPWKRSYRNKPVYLRSTDLATVLLLAIISIVPEISRSILQRIIPGVQRSASTVVPFIFTFGGARICSKTAIHIQHTVTTVSLLFIIFIHMQVFNIMSCQYGDV